MHYLEYFLNRYFFFIRKHVYAFVMHLCFYKKINMIFFFILDFNDATFLDETRHVNDIYSLSRNVDGIMTSFRCILSIHNRLRATNVLKSQLKTYPQVLHFRLWWDFAKTVCHKHFWDQTHLSWDLKTILSFLERCKRPPHNYYYFRLIVLIVYLEILTRFV